MTGLKQTNLPTPLKAQLAAGALAGQGTYGVMTDLAEQFGVSRPTVYSAGETADTVLTRYFEETEKEERFILVDERQLERAIGALRTVSPNSIRAIEMLLPTLYPGVKASFGKIQLTGCRCSATRRPPQSVEAIKTSNSFVSVR